MRVTKKTGLKAWGPVFFRAVSRFSTVFRALHPRTFWVGPSAITSPRSSADGRLLDLRCWTLPIPVALLRRFGRRVRNRPRPRPSCDAEAWFEQLQTTLTNSCETLGFKQPSICFGQSSGHVVLKYPRCSNYQPQEIAASPIFAKGTTCFPHSFHGECGVDVCVRPPSHRPYWDLFSSSFRLGGAEPSSARTRNAPSARPQPQLRRRSGLRCLRPLGGPGTSLLQAPHVTSAFKNDQDVCACKACHVPGTVFPQH